MQQKVESARHAGEGSVHPGASTAVSQDQLTDYDDGLLPAATKIMGVAYATALGIAALTFLRNGEALFAVLISTAYGLVFFGVPALMVRMRANRDSRWRGNSVHCMLGSISTYTGAIRRREALLQMVIVPLAVAAAFAAFGTIWILARP